MKERYTPEVADYMFGGVNQVSDEFRGLLAQALSKLPKTVVEWASENLLFISSTEDTPAFCVSKEEWNQKRGLVFLCETLKDESREKRPFTVAHEIAHQKLGHRSPIFSNLSREETENQERQADQLAEKWLGKR